MPLIIFSILFQALLVTHIVKTGRSTTWIWIVVMVPIAGGIAYLVLEVFTKHSSSRRKHRSNPDAKKTQHSHEVLKDAAKNYALSDSVENTIVLADELAHKKMHAEAAKLYRDCLRGTFRFDPSIMTKLAFSLFNLNEFSGCKRCLDELIEHNPDYRDAEAHLLYARCIAELDEVDAAIHEYETLSEYYPGPEATYRFALLLINVGRVDEARVYLQKILQRTEEYTYTNGEASQMWLTKAKNLLKTC